MYTTNNDEVVLRIGGDRYRFWERIRVQLSMDSIANITVESPPSDSLRPFNFVGLKLSLGGRCIMTGTLVSVEPSLGAHSKSVRMAGYSKCGVLQDVHPATDIVEFNKSTISSIAKQLAAPYSVGVDAEGSPTLERTSVDTSQRLWDYLQRLSSEHGFIMSDTPNGDLRIYKPIESEPVASLVEGESPLTHARARFNPQSYYSHITGYQSSEVNKKGAKAQVVNPLYRGDSPRHYNFRVSDTDGDNITDAVKAKAARMFGDTCTYHVSVATWRDPRGEVWEPGASVSLKAPSCFIDKPYTFLVRSVILEANGDSRSATLELVIPAAMTSEAPRRAPWQN